MAQYGGWVGKILNVDLTTREISILPTSNYVPKYIGGAGVGAKIHWDMVGPNVKGLDPENVITFMTGPNVGTCAPGGAKTFVTAVSPHMYPVESYHKSAMGGQFGPELKFAGYDGIIVRGVSLKPVYLLIEDDEVSIKDARNIWGMDTHSAQQNLYSRYSDKHKMAIIGPAGENLVLDAVIVTSDSNTAGKGGFGAVMGSKKLKAVVVRGTGEVPVARPEELLEVTYQGHRLVTRKETENEMSHYWRKSRFGPGGAMEGTDLWNEGLNGTARTGCTGCFACPVDCGFAIRFNDGFEIPGGHHMCLETYPMAEEMQVNNEYLGRTHYNRLKMQDRLGYSQWAWLMDITILLQYGMLTNEMLQIPYEIGSADFNQEILRKISYREGIGNELAKGVAHYINEFLGTPEAQYMYQTLAVTKGKSRFPYNYAAAFYGPVGWTGACVSSGRDNDVTWTFDHTPIDPRVVSGGTPEYNAMQERISKMICGSEQGAIDSRERRFGPYTAPMALFAHNFKAWLNSVGSCTTFQPWFSSYSSDYMGDMTVLPRLFSAVTGIDLTDEEWKNYQNRIWMLERALTTRQGRNKEDDWFYDCIFENPGYVGLTRDNLRVAVDHYYELRGMDVETGLPTRSTLESLDMKDIADDLEGKFGVSLPA